MRSADPGQMSGSSGTCNQDLDASAFQTLCQLADRVRRAVSGKGMSFKFNVKLAEYFERFGHRLEIGARAHNDGHLDGHISSLKKKNA